MDGALTLPMNFLVSPCQAHSPSGCGGEYHYTGILSFDGEKVKGFPCILLLFECNNCEHPAYFYLPHNRGLPFEKAGSGLGS